MKPAVAAACAIAAALLAGCGTVQREPTCGVPEQRPNYFMSNVGRGV